MRTYDTDTVISVTWFALRDQRFALPRIYYANLLSADPSIQLIYSLDDVLAHGGAFNDLMDALAAGALTRNDLVQLGHNLFQNGFTRSLVERFAEILLISLKTVYEQAWTPGVELAWTDILARASFVIQGADRRRHYV